MTTISDINDLKKNFPIEGLSVQVKKAFEPQEGEGKFGPWKIQAAIIKDETGEIRATFWNRFNLDFRNLEGEDITLESVTDSKGKPVGLTVDEYNGKKQVKVSEKAELESITGELPVEHSVPNERSEAPKTEHIPQKKFVSEETKRESIEKQVALKAAVDWAAQTDGGASADSVMEVAQKFYEFLHGNPEVI